MNNHYNWIGDLYMTYISRSVTLMMRRGGEFTRTGQYTHPFLDINGA